MGKRMFDLAWTDLGNEQFYALDEGVGTATRDLRICWPRGGGQQHFDIYTEHATDVNEPGTMSQAVITNGGVVTALLRINYEDTQGPDRIVGGIRAIRQEMEMRARAVTVSGNPLFADSVVADQIFTLLRGAEAAFAARGRAENHCAANS